VSDSDFYKNLSYSNDIEYVEKNISLNISANEITKKNILDYGCGVGDASYIFNKLSPATITGIDIGESNIHICKNNKSFKNNMLFIRADLNDYDLGVKKYDLIYSDTTIEFLQKDVEYILSDFKKAMKPNGVLYLSFTKKTLVNILIYKILNLIKLIFTFRIKVVFYYLILFKYFLGGVKIKDKNNIKNKVEYLFVPFIKLMSEDKVLNALKKNSFKLIYLRDRIKSDINSPPHIELKAILSNEK
jgi:ubiquinone/menaquinone biosynthesis C-methylase UbiE